MGVCVTCAMICGQCSHTRTPIQSFLGGALQENKMSEGQEAQVPLTLETLQKEMFQLSHSLRELEGAQHEFQGKTTGALEGLNTMMSGLVAKLNVTEHKSQDSKTVVPSSNISHFV